MVHFMTCRIRFVNLVQKADEMYRDMAKLNFNISNKILSSTTRYVKILTALFWTSALITGNMMCISAAIKLLTLESATENHHLILNSWFPFNHIEHYWIAYGIQLFIMNVGMLIVPCYHLFIVSVMLIVIAKLKILNSQLSELSFDDGRDPRKTFITFLRQRTEAREFLKELESLVAPSMCLDFFVFSVLICALLFEASQVEFLNLWCKLHHCKSFHSTDFP